MITYGIELPQIGYNTKGEGCPENVEKLWKTSLKALKKGTFGQFYTVKNNIFGYV